MALEIDTKDCNALSDADMSEMADLLTDTSMPHEVGAISKESEEWVLCSQATENGRLRGFAFYTLERIGGTPAIIIGMASSGRSSRCDSVLKGLVTDMMHRSVMAFPDEDVVIGAQMQTGHGFAALKSLNDIVPRVDHKASGEERAWGRRFAKRYGISPLRYADRSFTAQGKGSLPSMLDHVSVKSEPDAETAAMFDGLDVSNGDVLLGFGWAMSEDLAKLA